MGGKAEAQRFDAVKSRLLPLSGPDAALEQFIEWLPRRCISASLRVLQDIATIDADRGEYKATGTHPCFELILDDTLRGGVWLYLEAALVRNNGDRAARLQVERGAAEPLNWPITTNLRGSVREVLRLPTGVTRLLWFPTSSPGYFSQSPVLVHRIGVLESAARRWHRVVLTTRQFRHAPVESRAGLTLWRAVADLQDAYRRTAELRNRRERGADYALFLARTGWAASARLASRLRAAMALSPRPLISLLVPVTHPSPAHTRRMLKCVQAQAYRDWEVILLVEGDAAPEARGVASQLAAADSRVRVYCAGAGLSRGARFNAALEQVRGTHAAILGEHDLLHDQALLLLALEIAQHPDAGLFYTDEDAADALGTRSNPLFKPDWNPDLFLSTAYVGKLAVLSVDVVRRLGGFRHDVDGAELFDLLLRMRQLQPAPPVRHLPHVLYGRYVARNDAVDDQRLSLHANDAAGASRLRVLNHHLQPAGAYAVAGGHGDICRVIYPVPAPPPLVSLIVPTRDRPEVLRACIASIRDKTDYPRWEILIIDNGSVHPEVPALLAAFAQDPRIRVVPFDHPFNYSALNNHGASLANGEVLGLLNNDLEVLSPDWLREMVSHALRPGIGAVGAKLLYPDGSVQHAGVVLGIGGVAAHVHRFLPGDAPGYCERAMAVQNLSAVTGACMVVRKALYWEVGGLDADNLAVAFNDIDFCLKLREAGYRNLFTPHATLMHHESISRGRDDTPQKQAVFQREFRHMQATWGVKLHDDPAYNPNLTLEFGDFSLSVQT